MPDGPTPAIPSSNAAKAKVSLGYRLRRQGPRGPPVSFGDRFTASVGQGKEQVSATETKDDAEAGEPSAGGQGRAEDQCHPLEEVGNRPGHEPLQPEGDHVVCAVCGLNLVGWDLAARTRHVNGCLDGNAAANPPLQQRKPLRIATNVQLEVSNHDVFKQMCPYRGKPAVRQSALFPRPDPPTIPGAYFDGQSRCYMCGLQVAKQLYKEHTRVCAKASRVAAGDVREVKRRRLAAAWPRTPAPGRRPARAPAGARGHPPHIAISCLPTHGGCVRSHVLGRNMRGPAEAGSDEDDDTNPAREDMEALEALNAPSPPRVDTQANAPNGGLAKEEEDFVTWTREAVKGWACGDVARYLVFALGNGERAKDDGERLCDFASRGVVEAFHVAIELVQAGRPVSALRHEWRVIPAGLAWYMDGPRGARRGTDVVADLDTLRTAYAEVLESCGYRWRPPVTSLAGGAMGSERVLRR